MDPLDSKPIYLDYAATTPVDPRVLKEMLPYLTEQFGNPASRCHAYGWAAEEAVEIARESVAQLIGADPREIAWTSGATESNNLAIKGAAHFHRARGKHLITLKTEHKAVLDTMRELEREGFEVSVLDVQEDGLLDLDLLKAALRPDTILVSVMAVNNEIGVIQALGMVETDIVTKLLDFIPDATRNTVNLAYADIVIAGGKGLKNADNFKLVWDLARVLGAEVGATRAVTQAGWCEAERQVGQTGKTVRPKLYIAAGVSGAIQHRVGMEGADVIVAINTDPNAPIFDFAHHGIVGNAMQVLPVLTQAFRTHLDKRIRKVA